MLSLQELLYDKNVGTYEITAAEKAYLDRLFTGVPYSKETILKNPSPQEIDLLFRGIPVPTKSPMDAYHDLLREAAILEIKLWYATHRKPGWKAKAKAQPVPQIDTHKLYSPSQVAAILNVSYDTAIRRMLGMKGVMDMGTPETLHKRGKRMLRISGKHLSEFFRKHTLE